MSGHPKATAISSACAGFPFLQVPDIDQPAASLHQLGHLMASAYHAKSAEQLRAMADAVGRERILVLHARKDRMIPAFHGEKLMEMLEPKETLRMMDLD